MASQQLLVGLVEEEWPKVKQTFVFPTMHKPQTFEKADGFPSKLIKHTVLLNLSFIESLEAFGVDLRAIVSLSLAREVNLYLHIPYDFAEYLSLYASLREAVYSERLANRILNAFFDLWNDLELYANYGYSAALEKIYRASIRECGCSEEDNFYQALVGVLQAQWDVELGVELRGVHATLSRRLSELPYLDCPDRSETIKAFGAQISRIFRFVTVKVKGSGGGSSGGSASGTAEKKPLRPRWPLGDDRTQDLGTTLQNVQGGISHFIGSLHDGSVSDLFLEAVSRLGVGTGIQTTQFQPGRWWWYLHLAKRFPPIQVVKKESDRNSPVYPVDLTELSLSDNPTEYAPVQSFGKLWPGIAKKFLRTGGESQYLCIAMPWVIIVIDSSGSMVNPNLKKSYAVLSSFLAANAYLDHNAEVAVYNFSSSDYYLAFTDDETAIYKHLTAFQAGGTTLNEKILDHLLQDRPMSGREVDLLLISDMGISNMEGIISKFASYEGTHRIFLFLVRDTCGNFAEISERLSDCAHVAVYRIDNEEVLPELVLGAVQESLEDKASQATGHKQ